MKKLLLAALVFFILSVPAFAEDITITDEKIIDIPTALYSSSQMAISLDQTPEQEFYSYMEAYILYICENKTMTAEVTIPITEFYIPMTTKSSTAAEIAAASVIDPTDGTITQAEIYDIYANVAYNHPEIGNLITGGIIYGYYNSDGKPYASYFSPYFRPVYDEDEYNSLATDAEKQAYLNSHHNPELYLEATEYAFSTVVSPDMTETELIIALHNYFVENCTYEPIHATNGTAAKAYCEETNYLPHSPYSALVGDKITVCQGFSLAFKRLCDMAGIECGYAVTDSHIWNIVRCGDSYYHFDLTWDNTSTGSFRVDLDNGYVQGPCSDSHVLRHFIFMTDTEISQTHYNWTTFMPECNEDTLRESLVGGQLLNIAYPLRWENGNFYFEGTTHYYDADNNKIYHENDKYCKIVGDDVYSISKANYLPDIRLEAKMHTPIIVDNSYGFIAIDGTPNSSATLYAAEYDDDGRFVGVEKVDVKFDANGEAVAEFPLSANKLMLFENGSIKPLAYYVD